jgi:L-amino acid N-acyltransferase YncA
VAVEEPSSPDQLIGAHREAVLGYGSLSAFHDRPGTATTVENSVYVARGSPPWPGVGRLLLESWSRLATEHGFH